MSPVTVRSVCGCLQHGGMLTTEGVGRVKPLTDKALRSTSKKPIIMTTDCVINLPF